MKDPTALLRRGRTMEGVWAKTSIAAQIRQQVQAGGSHGGDLQSIEAARVASTSEECSLQAVGCAKVQEDKWTTAKTLVTGTPWDAKGCTEQMSLVLE